MSMWWDLFEGITEGVLTAAALQARVSACGNADCERGRIDRLCRELGWAVDERKGKTVYLYFNNPGGALRKVMITDGDEACVTLRTWSQAVLRADDVPADVLGYLLQRNLVASGIGMWGVYVAEDGDCSFHIMYQALGSGLDAATFKFICESLSIEAADFDGKLRQAQLLE